MDSPFSEKNWKSRFKFWSIGGIQTDGAKSQELIFLYERPSKHEHCKAAQSTFSCS